jgi:hypothetical protein
MVYISFVIEQILPIYVKMYIATSSVCYIKSLLNNNPYDIKIVLFSLKQLFIYIVL